MELEYPFNEIYSKGYLVVNPENRTNVCLVANDKRTTVSYGRYLISVKYGRILDKDEVVWHRDCDVTNYEMDNLEIVSKEEFRDRTTTRVGRQVAIIECPQCSEVFTIRKGNSQAIKSGKGKVKFCSMKCFRMFPINDYTKKELCDISAKTLLDVKRIHE